MNSLKKIIPILFILITGSTAFGQELKGVVLDNLDHAPISNVIVRNPRINEITFSDKEGNFAIKADKGDSILFVSQGYAIQKLTMATNETLHKKVVMERKAISLQEVQIHSGLSPYQLDSIERRRTYAGQLDQKKTNSFTSPVSILADRISKKARQRWKFQKNFEQWEEQKYIDTKYSAQEVGQLTGLKGDSLTAFMSAYPIPYDYVRNASPLEIQMWIRTNYKEWMKNPFVPDLSNIDPDIFENKSKK